MASDRLVAYHPPEWAKALSCVPELAMSNTPIHPWLVPGVPDGFSVSIKRDDMTGSTLSGNKVRKLEFLMADALKRGCRHVITCGSIQSNHCRAVAVCARQLGLTPHLILRTDATDAEGAGCEGNVLMDRLCGSHIYLVPKQSPYLTHLKPRMEKLAQDIKSVYTMLHEPTIVIPKATSSHSTGHFLEKAVFSYGPHDDDGSSTSSSCRASTDEDSYLVPIGGSSQVGLFGCITVFEEMRQQGVLESFDDVVCACGSGGTASGLSIGNYLTGSKLKVHAVAVFDNAEYFHNLCIETLQEAGLGHLRSEDILHVVEGHKGKGYGISTDDELDFIYQVACNSGVMLDPTYSGKAALGMVRELRNNPASFTGKRILFVHTGGVYELFDGRMTPLLQQKQQSQPTIRMWPDVNGGPL
ncbi:hypothetical protein BaRGS_00038781 [Batillaria attramentaria]|uniref:Tryptophan synthase beta chain-like PALP domain-containing protein n=1 Tax=Batillaria attramentaria TaxID=370345 RepID=A0ABD0J4Z8_9CAEN